MKQTMTVEYFHEQSKSQTRTHKTEQGNGGQKVLPEEQRRGGTFPYYMHKKRSASARKQEQYEIKPAGGSCIPLEEPHWPAKHQSFQNISA